MTAPHSTKELSDRDRLLTRPAGVLPTCEDPKRPRGYPADPKRMPKQGQGNDPNAKKLEHTA